MLFPAFFKAILLARIKPNLIQALIQVMAWRDFPTLNVRAIGIDLVPPERNAHVGLITEGDSFVFAHECTLFRLIGFPVHLFV